LSINGAGKALKQRADYKKEVMRVKAGVAVSVINETALNTAKGKSENADNLAAARKEAFEDKTNTATTPIVYNKDHAKVGHPLVPATGPELYGETLALWTAATQKKAATAPQFYEIARRAIMPEVIQPTFTNTTVKINTKTYEVYNKDKKTWGTSVPKPSANTTLEIRAKATAKAGKENNTTFAASKAGTLVITWGEVDTEKKTMGVVDAYIETARNSAGDLVDYKGVVRGRPTGTTGPAIGDPTVDGSPLVSPKPPPIRVTEGNNPITLTFDVGGLHENDNFNYYDPAPPSPTETPSPPPTAAPGEILILPKVEAAKGSSTSSVEILSMVKSGNRITMEVKPIAAGTVFVGLEVQFGKDEADKLNTSNPPENIADKTAVEAAKYYIKDLSGGRSVRFVIEPLKGTFEIREVNHATASPASEVKTKVNRMAKGTTSIISAAASGNLGELSISQNGDLRVSSLVGINSDTTSVGPLSGATYYTTASSLADIRADKAELSSPIISTGVIPVVHGQHLIIDLPYNSAVIRYVFALKDDVRPFITGASYGSSTITVTFSEPLKENSSVDGFDIQNKDGDVLTLPNGTTENGANSNQVTISAQTEPGWDWSAPQILHYVVTAGATRLQDQSTVSTNTVPDTQAYIGSSDNMVLQSITFSNGMDGMPVTFAVPPTITFPTAPATADSYVEDIVYVPLGDGASTITLMSSTTVGYSRQSRPLATAPSYTTASGAFTITLEAGNYLYVRVGTGEHYCFYISRKARASGSGASFSNANIRSIGNDKYTLTVQLNGAPIGPLKPGFFTVDAAEVTGVKFVDGTLTLSLTSNQDLNYHATNKLRLTYKGGGNILGPNGVRANNISFDVPMTGLPATPPPND
ncbi:MAG: hypothetical protein LBJ21_03745, partial [Acidobacteriota bacterium]|nr:hypothetical protein [Acidobacteriota bacterium]